MNTQLSCQFYKTIFLTDICPLKNWVSYFLLFSIILVQKIKFTLVQGYMQPQLN